MTPERWAEVERLYHAALAHHANERAAFLRDACADDEALRRDVESLLAQPASSDFGAARAIAIAAGLASTSGTSALNGRRFGAYQILGLLGAGGMGAVYRARDTNLGRDVAIKVLPRDFAAQPDRLARFDREARVLAALNHPHIGAIYGVEHVDGVPALVLELIEGGTLAERIVRGPMPLDEAMPIAKQIAAALEAAHDHGVIHRDLKPANIKVRSDGTVKVLDFGLAKAARTDGTPDLTQSPTVTIGGTREGVIVGTAAYMSPEQARGQAVDKRTDIWAFGCVLYEMLTGHLTFNGMTFSDTLAAVLASEPDWHRLPGSTPAAVRRLLRRCLAKPVARRLRDMGDALLELESVVGDETAQDPAITTGASRSSFFQPVTAAMSAIAAIAVIVAALAWWGRPAPASSTMLGPMTRLTSDSAFTTEPSISADGRLVAYASNRSVEGNLDVYVQQTSGGAAIRLTNDAADDREPTVSPDGSLVAFRSDRIPSGIYLAPALGGSARLIAPDGRRPHFSPDGRFIAYWTGPWLAPRGVGQSRQAFIVAATGGAPQQIAADVSNAGDPVWAPDGQSLLIFGRDAGNEPDWWWVPRDGGKPVKTGVFARVAAQQLDVTADDLYGSPQAWDDRGVLFSAADRTGDAQGLWRIAVDPKSGRVVGDPVRLTHGTTTDTSPSVSRDNRIVFAAQTQNQLIFGLPIDVNAGKVTGTMRRMRDDTAITGRASLSEDGRLMVFPKYEFASGGVWARDLTTGREWQLAVTPRTPLNPVITVDGEWTGYTVSSVDTGGGGGSGDGYVVKTSGGAPRRVCENCQLDQWTRDNRFAIVGDQGRRRISRLEVATGNRIPLLENDGQMDRLLFGPNGRWMNFNTPQHVYLAPIHPDRGSPKEEWTQIVSTPGAGRTAGLSPDGSLLYLLLETDGFRCLYGLRLDPNTGQPRGTPFLIAHFHDAARTWGSTGLSSAAVKGLFVTDLFEATSNIWMASFADR